ncbi:muscarinic acetylcholine receptor M2 isoform X2 [Alosa sapidissima]|uniref:muscarinic acetylcholine receptor M2 isoform X2 n=1 Tax=Alosa sapidissima TaxID=34773 RepID=UPI001C09F8E6|nr:muscarinic acetylcholine receptor M2 isoform X2 [Alosa sapidissima]
MGADSGLNGSRAGCLGNGTGEACGHHSTPYSSVETMLIIGAASSVSFMTILGNILVMLSICVNRHLQTVNNYFLFSLACADLVIGAFSMNIYTAYMLMGQWPFGPLMCSLWLVVDYVVSNSSNMHLLLISVDRYLCVTRPLTYPSRRTLHYAGLMVLTAWVFSLVLWAPAILIWQRFNGQRLHQRDECYIQLLSNPAVTLATAVPSFYLPAALMAVLYARISRASRRHSDPRSSAPNFSTTETTSRFLQVSAIESGALSHTSRAHPMGGPHAGEDLTPLDTESSQHSSQPAQTGEAVRLSEVGHQGLRRALRFSNPKLGGCASAPVPGTPTCGRVSKRSKRSKRSRRRGSLRERKVTRTILAVLLAFMVTWTPYNIMVLIGTFCHFCVSDTIWTISYWLCYINSTINPACYALCNETFKKTFRNLLLCRYKNINSK